MTSTAVADSQATPQAEAPKRRFKLHVPTAFTILFILTVIAVAATWMVPAGSYSKLAFDSSSQMLQVTILWVISAIPWGVESRRW